jgi:6,7-dimethyl-8-ribityllumazine synthase
LVKSDQRGGHLLNDFGGQVLRGDQGTISKKRFAVVVSKYHDSITTKLLNGAIETLKLAGADDQQITLVWVPGAWEIPVAVKSIVDRCDAVIALGVVIRGQTTHDQHISSVVSLTLGQIAVETGKPVSFGLLTCNDIDQAIQRSGGSVGNKGSEAASAAIEMLRLLDQVD